MSTGASTTGTQQVFHSQTDTDGSPRSIIHILAPNMSQAGSSSGGSASGAGGSGAGANIRRPIFAPQDQNVPTADELTAYMGAVEQHIETMEFLLDYLGDDRVDRPPRPSTLASDTTPVAIWRAAQGISKEVALFEKYINQVKIQMAQVESQALRQALAGPHTSSGSFKTPLPTKYDGKKGDLANTFIVACTNYRTMRPGVFLDDAIFIRWALQQMEDKAGQWKVRQVRRMDMERDDQGRAPKELRDWAEFAKFFLIQFGDPGLVEKARVKWKEGLNQTGKAVDYFEEIEGLLLRLDYPRDSPMTLDQVIAGLKPHICTHFIGKEWPSLNEMKSEIVPYDLAFWEINKNKTAADRAKAATNPNRSSSQPKERGQSQTPIKAEVSKAGGTNRRFLPQEEFEECKKNRWCFMCKADGLKIVGSAKFHPNHLPQTTKNKDKDTKSTKIAAMDGKEQETVSCADVDSDDDYEEKSKN